MLRQLGIGVVHRRLAEHGADALVKQSLVDALHVVAVEQAQAGERPDAQQAGELVLQAVCLDVKAGMPAFASSSTMPRASGSSCATTT